MRAETVRIDGAGVPLDGHITVPDDAAGCVVFVHGSGSSRHSPRNLQVAQTLHEAGLATLPIDLLCEDEARRDAVDAALRFDIPMLGERLMAAVDDALGRSTIRALPFGLFGASTGAAAALICDSQRPEVVRSVVSRGGRADLAGEALATVSARRCCRWERETDRSALNEEAARLMAGETEVSVVARATHLFEEPGALDEVSRRAAAWFNRNTDRLGRAPNSTRLPAIVFRPS